MVVEAAVERACDGGKAPGAEVPFRHLTPPLGSRTGPLFLPPEGSAQPPLNTNGLDLFLNPGEAVFCQPDLIGNCAFLCPC